MSREIRLVAPDDLADLLRIRRASFPTPTPADASAARTRLEARLPWTWGSYVDGRLAAVATWFPYRAWIGGVRQETGALASVASSPETRRRGHVRALLADGLERLRDRGVGFALEHPFDPRFYDAMGFRTVAGAVTLDLPMERIPPGPIGVEFDHAGPLAAERIVGVHEAYARRWTFALDRDWRPGGEAAGDGPQWGRLLGDARDGSGPLAYTTRGGYALLDPRPGEGGERLDVVDMAWTDAAARERVLAILAAWRGQARRVVVDLPISDPLARDEAPRYGVGRPTLQARLVDLTHALTPLTTRATRRDGWTVRVHDAFCRWNDGTWRIAPGPEGTSVERARGGADAEVGIGGLVSLLSGTPPAVLLADGEAEGDADALADLAGLTANHPPFLHRADYF